MLYSTGGWSGAQGMFPEGLRGLGSGSQPERPRPCELAVRTPAFHHHPLYTCTRVPLEEAHHTCEFKRKPPSWFS